MGIRRTREQKIRAQQRRAQESYRWEEVAPDGELITAHPRRSPEPPPDALYSSWFVHDLWQTLVALLFVLVLLLIIFWQRQ